MRVSATIATSKDSPWSPHRCRRQPRRTEPCPISPTTRAYERLLAVGLGVALALVAALALMVPGAPAQASGDGAAVTAVQTTAHGKATPRTTAAAPAAGGDSTSVE